MAESSKARFPPLTKLRLIVLISLLTCGRAIREGRQRLTGNDGDEPAANTSSDAEPASEVIDEAKKEIEKELEGPQRDETKCKPVHLTLQGGHRPGVFFYSGSSGGVVVWPASKYGQFGLALGSNRDMQLHTLGDKDVSKDSETSIVLHWASLVRGDKDYPVELDCDDSFPGRILTTATTRMSVGVALMFVPVLLLFVSWCSSSMIVFAFDALSCGPLGRCETKVGLAVFIMPCFFCRLCGVCSWSVLAAVPPGPEPRDENAPQAYAVPRLDQGWLIRATDRRCIRTGVVVAFAAALTCTLYFQAYASQVRRVELAMLYCMAFCQLGLGLAVTWGLRASRHVLLVADGATCPEDVRKSLPAEFRMIACILGPRALLTILVGMGVLCAGLAVGVQFVRETVVDGIYVALWDIRYDMYNDRYSYLLGTCFACEGVLFIMTVTFLLEATIAARVVEAHVSKVKTGLDMTVADPGSLKNTCHECGKLANEVLPELAKISGPLLCVATLKAAFHFACVVLALSRAAKAPANPSFLLVLGLKLACSLLDLLVGPLCLFLPARVSDAFADLLDTLNKLRVKPVKEGCDAEVDRC